MSEELKPKTEKFERGWYNLDLMRSDAEILAVALYRHQEIYYEESAEMRAIYRLLEKLELIAPRAAAAKYIIQVWTDTTLGHLTKSGEVTTDDTDECRAAKFPTRAAAEAEIARRGWIKSYALTTGVHAACAIGRL